MLYRYWGTKDSAYFVVSRRCNGISSTYIFIKNKNMFFALQVISTSTQSLCLGERTSTILMFLVGVEGTDDFRDPLPTPVLLFFYHDD